LDSSETTDERHSAERVGCYVHACRKYSSFLGGCFTCGPRVSRIGRCKRTGRTGTASNQRYTGTVGNRRTSMVGSCTGNRTNRSSRAWARRRTGRVRRMGRRGRQPGRRGRPTVWSRRQPLRRLARRQRCRWPALGQLRRWIRWRRRPCTWRCAGNRLSPRCGNNRSRRRRSSIPVGPSGHRWSDRWPRSWSRIGREPTARQLPLSASSRQKLRIANPQSETNEQTTVRRRSQQVDRLQRVCIVLENIGGDRWETGWHDDKIKWRNDKV